MKKYTNIFLVAVVLIFGLFGASNAQAAVDFENTSSCWPDVVQAMVGTGNNQGQTSCNQWLSNPNVNPGGNLWVGVYIHNTGNTASNNTNVSLTKNETSQNSFSFQGTVSGGGSTISGSATANINSPSDQDFNLQSVKLYINQHLCLKHDKNASLLLPVESAAASS